jgi:methionyl-tRNA synthetase
MSNYYVCTSIPYVNGEPHLGHAMEFLMADVLARYHRSLGDTVLYGTGTDEHGGKIAEKANELGITPKALSDQMSQKFRDLAAALNITPDHFIRTTDADHEKRAQKIWTALAADIYKNQYIGWYCTGDEEFFSETVVKENHNICPDHNRPYEKIEEENYFFRLSKYTDRIREAITSNTFEIVPATRRNEILSLLNEGLDDISISRPKAKISWGIPVPGDPKQVMYVWFEALMNYITTLGYPDQPDFEMFWPANVQVVGKGIIRFHAAIWPGMLCALNLPLLKKLYVHGYVTVNDKKMSKSLGNTVSPLEIIDKYGADAFRYFFLRHIPSYGDGDFTWETFEASYNNELANELGNAVSRTAAMIDKYQAGAIGMIPPAEHDSAQYEAALEACHFDKALDEVWEQVRGLNQFIDVEKPWVIAKTGDSEHLQEVLASLVSDLLEIADLLLPFLPETAAKIRSVFASGTVVPLKTTLFPKTEVATT